MTTSGGGPQHDELARLRRQVKELEAHLEARKQDEARFRDLTLSLADWVWEVDAEGRYTYSSGRVADLLGFAPEEVLGKKPSALMAPEEAARVEAVFADHVARKAPIVDLINWNVGRDGQRVCLLTNGVPILDESGEVVGYRGVDKDVTANRRNAERLLASERRLRAFLDTLPDVLVIVNEDGVYLEAHTAQEGLLYRQAAQLRGKSIDELHPPERAKIFRRVVAEAIESGKLVHIEYELEVPLGLLWFEGRCLRLPEAMDGKRAAVFVARDVTARKRAELELARSNRDLAQFAAIASHDLKEPLRTVSGHLKLIEDSVESDLDSETKELLGAAVGGAQRMSQLVDDLLAYSRVGADERRFGEVDLARTLDQVRSALAASLREQEARISVRGALPRVWGNDRQLELLLQNLLANALKFRSEVTPQIRLQASRDGGFWLLEVKDNGVGIAPAHHEAIFEAFRRGPSDRWRPGSGIGLAICRRIVEHHGGRIWVQSRPDEGACFCFTLPASTGPHDQGG